MKIHNPFYSNNPIITVSVVATICALVTLLGVGAILAPEVVLTVIALILLAGVVNVVKYIFTGKGFIQ
jgi:hypothetical protein